MTALKERALKLMVPLCAGSQTGALTGALICTLTGARAGALTGIYAGAEMGNPHTDPGKPHPYPPQPP